MKKVKALLDFIQFSISVKITFYYNVIAKLTNSSLFPSPDVSLTEAKAVVDGLEASHLATKDGSHTAISAMYDAEEKADDMFRILVAYVNRVANGDETILLSSVFYTWIVYFKGRMELAKTIIPLSMSNFMARFLLS